MTRPRRVLITGAAGQVGVDLVDTLHGVTPLGGDALFQPDEPIRGDEFEVLALTRHELDITNHDSVVRALELTRPDVIVHLAAYTQVDRAETEPELCFAVNTTATETLSQTANTVGAHFISISSDYVFDGEKGDAYVEGDTTNPLGVYGASKRDGELVCSEHDTVVRASWVMGVRGKNVLHVIAERAKNGQSVRFVNDQMGTVTLASDLARALATLVRDTPGGLWHVANKEPATWFEVANFAGTVLGRGEGFATPITTDELEPQPLATRPRRSDLDTTKWTNKYRALPDWHEGVVRLLEGRNHLASAS